MLVYLAFIPLACLVAISLIFNYRIKLREQKFKELKKYYYIKKYLSKNEKCEDCIFEEITDVLLWKKG